MATLPAVHALDEAPGVVASPERIDAWMTVAKPGARFLYASRACLPVGSRGAARMRELEKRGLVRLVRARSTLDRTVFNYMAERTSATCALARPDRSVLAAPSVAPIADEARLIDALLPVLTRFAHHGRPCPTDKQLGARAGLVEAEVKAGLTALVASHLIVVRGCSAPTYRRVTIVATGDQTGLVR